MKYFLLTLVLFLNGCAVFESRDTSYPDDACLMLKENPDWIKSLHKSSQKWDVPSSVFLSIINAESSFVYNARPISEKGFFWDTYLSSAYGYSQALDSTWDDFKRETDNIGADRTSFDDSVNFIGWYINKIHKMIKINRHDTYNIYLAYHEGIGGYKKKTYNKKIWLKKKASQVNNLTKIYSKQIKKCDF